MSERYRRQAEPRKPAAGDDDAGGLRTARALEVERWPEMGRDPRLKRIEGAREENLWALVAGGFLDSCHEL